MITQLGNANKYVRKGQKHNRSTNKVAETDEELTSSVRSNTVNVTITRGQFSGLDRAISSCEKMLMLLQETIEHEGDDDGDIRAEMARYRRELRRLLATNMEAGLNEHDSQHKKMRFSEDD